MSLAAGVRLGPYEVLGLLGAGGMGEVYRARDSRLERDVALKVLPTGLSADPERLRRFEKEARAAAALNHSNILAVHDFGQHDGSPYIVSELLEGETLRERLATGPLPVRKAVEYGVQIAHGLAAAHEKGITHRDLKPENLFVTSDGHVKILDFGLAKLTESEAASAGASTLPTAAANTAAGVVLGTMGYMSPEQVRGLPADRRSDIFAFGTVLYEMLSGRRAFRGDTFADTMSAILKEDPVDLPAADRHIPPALVRIVDRCVEKNPSARFQSVSDLGFALEGLSSPPELIAPPGLSRTRVRRERLAWTLFVVALVAALAAASALALVVAGVVDWNRRPRTRAPVTRFAVVPPGDQTGSRFLVSDVASSLSSLAVSRDGNHIVFTIDGVLYLRRVSEMDVRRVMRTGAFLPASQPVFSPDGQSLLYVEGPTPAAQGYLLMKVPVTGGTPVSVFEGPRSRLLFDVTWETEDTILYVEPAGIMRISAGGGMPEALVRSVDGETLSSPHLLPGGKWVLFSSTKATTVDRWDSAQIMVQSIDAGERRLILKGGADARYLSTGHLVFARGSTLFALPFDADDLRVTGSPEPLVEGVRRSARGASGTANYSVADTGTLVYLTPTTTPDTPLGVLAFVDRNGVVEKLNVDSAQYRGPALSPDGRQLTVEIVASDGRSDVWVFDLSGDTAPRQLTQGGNSGHPIWGPGLQRITFRSTRDGRSGIYSQTADGSGTVERLTIAEQEGEVQTPDSWSPDGRTLSYSRTGSWPQSGWTLSRNEGAKPIMFVGGKERGAAGAFSPDGRWLAYRENARAGEQIYIQPFPPSGEEPRRITQAGGASPLWSRNGRELFYRRGIDGITKEGPRLMRVGITMEGAPQWTNEQALPIKGFEVTLGYRDYDITPDGKRFLMIVPAGSGQAADASRPPVNVVVNWTEEVKARVPVP